MTGLLARHIGHRLTLLDERRLRCVDCSHVVLLPAVAGSTSPTSNGPAPYATSDVPPSSVCRTHPGEWSAWCGPCRAEELEAERVLDQQPTADVAAGAASTRQALAASAARRRQQDPTEETA